MNQDASKPGSNAYHDDGVAKKQMKETEQHPQQPERISSSVYYSNTLDDDDAMYEYVSEDDIRRAGRP